jgi:ElaB/YqjD/DUF883 family membrane-anchored ribosome-binding protein
MKTMNEQKERQFAELAELHKSEMTTLAQECEEKLNEEKMKVETSQQKIKEDNENEMKHLRNELGQKIAELNDTKISIEKEKDEICKKFEQEFLQVISKSLTASSF